jgi:hypothetical protein
MVWQSSTCGKAIRVLEIYNILGEKVYIRQLQTVIDVSTLPAGMYFLEMKSESGIATQRFVKE